MPRSATAQTIRRLLTALEACAAEEAGLTATEDWAGLAELFVRELALLHRLAHEKQTGGQTLAHDAELMMRVAAVQNRHALLRTRLTAGHARLQTRIGELDQTRRRVRAVRSAYHLHAA